MDFYGGTNSAVNAVATDATAFGHRDSLWTIQFYASSGSPPFPSDGLTFLDSKKRGLSSLGNALTDVFQIWSKASQATAQRIGLSGKPLLTCMIGC